VGSTRREQARGINELEGYLLWQAETASAQEQADAFANRLPWLTGEQRAVVVREYAADRLEVSRAVVRRIAGRARELQAEYCARYRTLRMRLVALLVMAVLAAWVSALPALTGRRV
jgi:hypothetical protein